MAKIHPRVIHLQETSTQILTGSHRLESFSRPQGIRDEQSVFFRHRTVPAGAVDRNIQRPAVGNIVRRVGIVMLQCLHGGEVRVVELSDGGVSVASSYRVVEDMSKECIVDASTGEGDIDSCPGDDAVLVRDSAVVVFHDFVVCATDIEADGGERCPLPDIVRGQGQVAAFAAYRLRRTNRRNQNSNNYSNRPP